MCIFLDEVGLEIRGIRFELLGPILCYVAVIDGCLQASLARYSLSYPNEYYKCVCL